jgi:YgiT-type zinc finger domain-containing protein
MKCVICKDGELGEGTATVTLERLSTTVVVKAVPARVCQNCGEEFVDQAVASALLRDAEDAFKRGVEVDVKRFLAA